MSHIKAIKLALDTRLRDLNGSNNIAWENIEFKPTLNLMYLRPTLLPAPSGTMNMEGIQTNPGIYQIDVFAPLNKGARAVLDKMDDIYSHFKAQKTLENDDVKVYIRVISQLGPLAVEQSWLVGTVQINYDCYAD